VETGEHVTLDYCGRIPRALTPELMTADARNKGALSSTVPGSPAGWLAVLGRFGSLPAAEVFAPAVELARRGFPLTAKNAEFFVSSLALLEGPEFAECHRTYTMGGLAPVLGMVLRQPELAASLELLAAEGPAAFYTGGLGAKAVAELGRLGGRMTAADLAGYEPEWGTPVSTTYRGRTVSLCAPPKPLPRECVQPTALPLPSTTSKCVVEPCLLNQAIGSAAGRCSGPPVLAATPRSPGSAAPKRSPSVRHGAARAELIAPRRCSAKPLSSSASVGVVAAPLTQTARSAAASFMASRKWCTLSGSLWPHPGRPEPSG
jgi:hypothetical protein